MADLSNRDTMLSPLLSKINYIQKLEIKRFCKKINILLLFIMQNPNNVVLFVLRIFNHAKIHDNQPDKSIRPVIVEAWKD
jgi:hypothetical protein